MKDYFRAQMIYTCFQRRLGKKKLCANLKTFSKPFPVWQSDLLKIISKQAFVLQKENRIFFLSNCPCAANLNNYGVLWLPFHSHTNNYYSRWRCPGNFKVKRSDSKMLLFEKWRGLRYSVCNLFFRHSCMFMEDFFPIVDVQERFLPLIPG